MIERPGPVAQGDEQPLAGERELVDLAELDLERGVPDDQQPLGREDALTGELVRAVAEQVAGDHRRGSDVDCRLARSQAFRREAVDIDAGQPLGAVADARLVRLGLVLADATQDLLRIADPGAADLFDRPGSAPRAKRYGSTPGAVV